MIPKYYCTKCRKFKKRSQLKINNYGYWFRRECKYCHTESIVYSKRYLEKIIGDYTEWENK